MQLLREFIKSALLEKKREPFNLEYFKTLNTREDLEEYLDFHSKVIGAGEGRTAYDIGDAVVKFARNKNGLSQNKMEANTFQCAASGAPVVRVRQAHPARLWILVDKVEPLKSKASVSRAVKAVVALKDADELTWVVDAGLAPPGSKEVDPQDIAAHKRLYQTNEWYKALFDTVKSCEINPLELHEGNWGLDENGDLVLLDTGG